MDCVVFGGIVLGCKRLKLFGHFWVDGNGGGHGVWMRNAVMGGGVVVKRRRSKAVVL